MIVEELETYDEWLRKSERRKEQWQIVGWDESALLTSIGREGISKAAVMEKIQSLKFSETETCVKKKTAFYLYIDVNEDHGSLQYLEKKGIWAKKRGAICPYQRTYTFTKESPEREEGTNW